MSLLALYTWNEQNSLITRDYSTLGNDGVNTTFSFVAAETGYACGTNGINEKATFGDVINVGGTDNLSIFLKVRVGTKQEQSLAYKEDQWEIGLDANNKAWFKLELGGVSYELTSTTSVTIEGDYKTIAFTYNGTSALIYIDGVLDATTLEQTGNFDVSTRDVILGSNGTDLYHGRYEMFSAYSQTLTQAEVTALHDKPGGFVCDFKDTTDFSLGDLLESSVKGTASAGQYVVTGDLGSNQLLILPIANDLPTTNDIIKRVGNVHDTARQCLMKHAFSGADPTMYVYTGVTSFTLPTPTVQIGCDGITNPADPTNPTKVLRGDGSWGYVRLFSQYALKTITNTTTKTTLFGTGEGSPIVPAGYFDELGVMANLIMMGSWSKSTGGALILLIEITDSAGTQEIHRKAFTNAQLGGGGTTTGHWEIRMLSTCYATGASGSLMTHASLSLLENNSAEILGTHSETSQVTVDFTGTIEIVVTAQWDTASTSLSIGSANVILKAQ